MEEGVGHLKHAGQYVLERPWLRNVVLFEIFLFAQLIAVLVFAFLHSNSQCSEPLDTWCYVTAGLSGLVLCLTLLIMAIKLCSTPPVEELGESTPLSEQGLPAPKSEYYDDYSEDKYTLTDYIAVLIGGPLSIFGFVWYAVGLFWVFESEIGGTCQAGMWLFVFALCIVFYVGIGGIITFLIVTRCLSKRSDYESF